MRASSHSAAAPAARARPARRRPASRSRASASASPVAPPAAAPADAAAPGSSGSGGASKKPPAWLVRLGLARAPPWAAVAPGTCLVVDLGGALPETAPSPSPFSLGAPQPLTLPGLRDALRKAAVDPRIVGVSFKLAPLSAGWARLQEARGHILAFRAAAPAKFTVAYADLVTEREMFVMSAAEEVYVPESAYVSLRGLSVSGSFLRGVLAKAGVEPQIKRIGSACEKGMRTRRMAELC